MGLFKAGVFYPSFAYRGEEKVDKKNVWNYELDGKCVFWVGRWVGERLCWGWGE